MLENTTDNLLFIIIVILAVNFFSSLFGGTSNAQNVELVIMNMKLERLITAVKSLKEKK